MSFTQQVGQIADNYQNAGSLKNPVPVAPRTLVSAATRMDAVNERLGQLDAHLNAIADQLGVLRAAQAGASTDKMPPCGAVARLNDAADGAHYRLSEIEATLKSISGALG